MSEEVSGALPSLISLMVSVDIKQYLYVLSRLVEVGRERRQIGRETQREREREAGTVREREREDI